MVQREIQKCGFEDLLAGGVVITGGATLLNGISELAEEVLGLPVRRGHPRAIGGLVDVVRSPMYATGVGLVLYGVRNQDMRYFGLQRTSTKVQVACARGWERSFERAAFRDSVPSLDDEAQPSHGHREPAPAG